MVTFILVILILILVYIVIIQELKIKKLLSVYEDSIEFKERMVIKLNTVLQNIRSVDFKGSFETDDEISFIWIFIKESINEIKKSLEIIERQNAKKKDN